MQALSAAVELSAAKHIDLETAVNLVGKAFIGNSTLLARYGVDVETATKAHAAMKQGTDELAAALQKAGTGSLQPFSKALDDAGISLTGAKGKIEDATKVAGELVKAFEAGKLSSDTFSEIMTKLGVTFDWNKAKASDYQAVLQILNEQYAGAAQAQARPRTHTVFSGARRYESSRTTGSTPGSTGTTFWLTALKRTSTSERTWRRSGKSSMDSSRAQSSTIKVAR
jgi:hypothetical protein